MVRAQPHAARVNNMMMAEAHQSLDIVFGRLLVSSVPATVLFDSGASHSFISNAFAISLDIPRAQLSKPLSVCSAGSRLDSSKIVPNVEISIQGVLFSASLIALP